MQLHTMENRCWTILLLALWPMWVISRRTWRLWMQKSRKWRMTTSWIAVRCRMYTMRQTSWRWTSRTTVTPSQSTSAWATTISLSVTNCQSLVRRQVSLSEMKRQALISLVLPLLSSHLRAIRWLAGNVQNQVMRKDMVTMTLWPKFRNIVMDTPSLVCSI